ncbi:hypothetical protein [Luteibacter sp. CQ10]|uniref:hypothetical protein n=1 Tax=Luteibacter sp. CQ10 TaxID=2805821 RepID=UPI0034A2FE4A
MEAAQISEQGMKRLSRLGLPVTPSLNALGVAFRSACAKLDPPSQAMLDEPGLTTMFLGVLREAADLCAEEFGADGVAGCTWVQYSAQGPDLTEPRTGADFAIVVRLGAGVSRMAIFQAKKGVSETPMVLQVHRMSPALKAKKDEPAVQEEPQFTRLVRYSWQLMGRAAHATIDLSPLSWVHYVAYNRAKPPETFSLDQMGPVRDEYARRTAKGMDKANSISLAGMTAQRFADMLSAAAETPYDLERPLSGWMDVQDTDVDDRMVKLAKHMDIYVARDRTAGPVPEFLPKTLLERGRIFSVPSDARPPSMPANEPRPLVGKDIDDGHREELNPPRRKRRKTL